MVTKSFSVPAIFALLLIAGCGDHVSVGSTDVDQSTICQVSTWSVEEAASACKPGQKIIFLPETFYGNEAGQSLKFTGLNCDLQKSVVQNSYGVTCIYRPVTQKPTSLEKLQLPN